MFKSLEELRNNDTLENLNKYYDESQGKSAYEKEYFSKTLLDMILYDIGFLVFSCTALKFAVDCIQEARRSL